LVKGRFFRGGGKEDIQKFLLIDLQGRWEEAYFLPEKKRGREKKEKGKRFV